MKKLALVYSPSSEIYMKALMGFRKLGYQTEIFDDRDKPKNISEFDCFIMLGNDYKNRAAKEYVYKNGKRCIIITSSFFEGKNPTKYVRVHANGFVNNMCTMPEPDYDRWTMLRQYHQYDNIFEKKQGDKIVIALNAQTSPAMMKFDVSNWFFKAAKQLREHTDKPLYVRTHRKKKEPLGPKFQDACRRFKVKEISDTKEAEVPHHNISTAISFTTTFSVKSLMFGTPHIAMHEGNFVSDITRSTIKDKNLDFYPDKDSLEHHYSRLANCEWSLEEIHNGKCWETLLPYLQSNPKLNYHWLGDQYGTV